MHSALPAQSTSRPVRPTRAQAGAGAQGASADKHAETAAAKSRETASQPAAQQPEAAAKPARKACKTIKRRLRTGNKKNRHS